MINPNQKITLGQLDSSYKILFTGFLLVIGLGLMMAGGQIMLTHGMADGKPGLSVDDIVYSYYGNRTGSKLEGFLTGKMKAKAPEDVRFAMIQWARDGAPASEWPKLQPMFQKHCAKCHDEDSGLMMFDTVEGAQKAAEVDQGVSISTLTRVSHIHLFGISFIFYFVCRIFALAEFDRRWKGVLIATPFAFLIVDVMSWWLTKFWPGFAWATMIGGFGYSVAAMVMIATSLLQMWLPRWSRPSV